MISFVIPAHNEEACLGRTLEAIHSAARALSLTYEIVVANDASTDATADVARRHGAQVVQVSHRQIATTRNSGARASHGDRIFFVDADTEVNFRAVRAALREMDNGAVGGGAPVWVEGPVPLYVRIIEWLGGLGCTLVGFTGGAFMFCTRAAFEAVGGFNERVYWAEEGWMTMALRREGKFVVLWQRVLTSGRRFRRNSGAEFIAGMFKMIASPVKMLTRRDSVKNLWYDSNRATDDILPTAWSVRLSNGIALILLLAVLSGPIWTFIPGSLTPWTSVIGKVRFFCAFLIGHVGLLLIPVGFILLVNLFRQKRFTNILQSIVVIAFCIWESISCVQIVLYVWREMWISLTS